MGFLRNALAARRRPMISSAPARITRTMKPGQVPCRSAAESAPAAWAIHNPIAVANAMPTMAPMA